MKDYTSVNAKVINQWVKDGWIWGKPITHAQFIEAKKGNWEVYLTPTKPVPKAWFPELKGLQILGLASGGAQQMPIFSAMGATCTVLDYTPLQLQSERIFAEQEGYKINTVLADMSKPLPFQDNSFDMIFHPVSNCYVEELAPIWKECYRILKKGGCILSGFDIGINYIFDDTEKNIIQCLPYNPLKDKMLYQNAIDHNDGIQFSHTIEEEIGGQLHAGLKLQDIYHDINETGNLHDYNVPTFYATLCKK